MVSVCLPSDALLQHLPSYLGFSYLGHGVSLHSCSSKAQPLLLTLDEGYLLTVALPDLQHEIAPLGPPVPAQPWLLGRGVGPPGHRPWPQALGRGVALPGHCPWPRTWGDQCLTEYLGPHQTNRTRIRSPVPQQSQFTASRLCEGKGQRLLQGMEGGDGAAQFQRP